jgi:hypothetical protein
MNIDTDYKTIGLREVRVVPESFYIKFNVDCEKLKTQAIQPVAQQGNTPAVVGAKAVYDIISLPIKMQITHLNSLEEIIDSIVSLVNANYKEEFLQYNYDVKTSRLEIYTNYKNNEQFFGIHNLVFRITPVPGLDEIFGNLCQLLNLPSDYKNKFQNWTQTMEFPHVWNRRTLYIHSTIANTTPYNYLAHDNEFYQTPSKLYKWTSKSKTFRVWVSFDGQIPVVLYHQPFLIQLQMIASCHR